MKEPLLLAVDVSNWVWSDWATTCKADPSGEQAALQFMSRVNDAVRKWAPSHVAMCFDSTSSVRKAKEPTYKANRDQKPEGLYDAMDRVSQMSQAHGYACLHAEGFEGDDLIASAVTQHKGLTIIASTDKDVFVLLSGKRVVILRKYNKGEIGDPKRKAEWFTEHDLYAKFGIFPCQMKDWLTLVGDKADCIEGAKQFGEKRAPILLRNVGTLTGIERILDDIELDGKPLTKADKTNLLEMVTRIGTTRFLLTLKRDLEIPDTTYRKATA